MKVTVVLPYSSAIRMKFRVIFFLAIRISGFNLSKRLQPCVYSQQNTVQHEGLQQPNKNTSADSGATETYLTQCQSFYFILIVICCIFIMHISCHFDFVQKRRLTIVCWIEVTVEFGLCNILKFNSIFYGKCGA